MKNIHVLATDKPSKIGYIFESKSYHIFTNGENPHNIEDNLAKAQHIYITSDEEIKEGDFVKLFVKHIDKNWVHKVTKEDLLLYPDFNNEGSKIILTTDQDLIKDGIQAIDDDFLEWFVKNPSCEEVEVFHQDVYSMGKWDIRYKIIIPKEEPKQETLEEAAKNYVNGRCTGGIMERALLSAIEFGAKWQQERMYSEEDFKLFARQYYRKIKLDKSNLLWDDLADKCLEQFKKK